MAFFPNTSYCNPQAALTSKENLPGTMQYLKTFEIYGYHISSWLLTSRISTTNEQLYHQTQPALTLILLILVIPVTESLRSDNSLNQTTGDVSTPNMMADIGTGPCTLTSIQLDSEWINGHKWMQQSTDVFLSKSAKENCLRPP